MRDEEKIKLSWSVGTAEIVFPTWKVTRRTIGRWWWKQTVYDANNGTVAIYNMDASMVAMLHPREIIQ